MMKIFCLWFSLLCFWTTTAGGAENVHLVAGAGPSTEIVKLFFAEAAKLPGFEGNRFEVMESSVKHLGGIRHSDSHLFGRTGRPLNDEEKALGKREILLGKNLAAFAVGLETGVKRLTLEQVEKIFTRKIVNWKEVGGQDAPILLAGRDKKESILTALREDYPFFEKVSFDRVFDKDQDMENFLASPLGRFAIGFGSRSGFPPQSLVEMANFTTGVKIGLVYDEKNESHPLVQAARRFSETNDWRALAKKNGFQPLR